MIFMTLLFAVAIAMGVGLLVYGNKYQLKEKSTQFNSFNPRESIAHLKDVFGIDKIYEGVIYKHDQCLLLAKIEGINLTVMSEIEQNARESALIEALARLDYPIRFISNTVVVDTSQESARIADLANKSPDGSLKIYRTLYAGALEQMRVERSVLTQQVYLVVPGSTPEEVRTRLDLLSSSLREQTSVIITPIETSDDVYDAIQNVLMPEKIVKSSDIVAAGVLEPVHFSVKEASDIVEKIQTN
jgi:hypothetical protein